jgi:hypothetical protein
LIGHQHTATISQAVAFLKQVQPRPWYDTQYRTVPPHRMTALFDWRGGGVVVAGVRFAVSTKSGNDNWTTTSRAPATSSFFGGLFCRGRAPYMCLQIHITRSRSAGGKHSAGTTDMYSMSMYVHIYKGLVPVL